MLVPSQSVNATLGDGCACQTLMFLYALFCCSTVAPGTILNTVIPADWFKADKQACHVLLSCCIITHCVLQGAADVYRVHYRIKFDFEVRAVSAASVSFASHLHGIQLLMFVLVAREHTP